MSCPDYKNQCFLLHHLTSLAKLYKNMTQKDDDEGRLTSSVTIMDGSPSIFINRFNRRKKMEPFLDLTTAQRALLQPKIKISLHERKNSKTVRELPYVFSDRTTKSDENRLLSAQGRNRAIGVQQFTLSLEGGYPFNSDSYVNAQLTLHANSIEDLFDGHPPGTAQYYTLMVPGIGSAPEPLKDPTTGVKYDKSRVQDPVNFSTVVNIGWSAPQASEGLIGPQLRAALEEMTVVCHLTPNDHDIQVQENGTVKVTISYHGQMRASLRSYRADIFNFNNKMKAILDGTDGISVSDAVKRKARDADMTAWAGSELNESEAKAIGNAVSHSTEAAAAQGDDEGATHLAASEKAIDVAHEEMSKRRERSQAAKDIIVEEKKRMLKRSKIQNLFRHIEDKGGIFFMGTDSLKEFIEKYCKQRDILERQMKEAEAAMKTRNAGRPDAGAKETNSAKQAQDKLTDIMENEKPRSKGVGKYSPPGSSASKMAVDDFDKKSGASEADAGKLPGPKSGLATNASMLDDASTKIPFVFLGDIIDAAMAQVDVSDQAKLDSKTFNYRIILGPMQYIDPQAKLKVQVNLADIPIDLHDFQRWINKKVIKMGASGMTLSSFITGVLNDLVMDALGKHCFFPNLNLSKGSGRNPMKFSTIEISVDGKRSGFGYEDPLKGVNRMDVKDFKARYYGNDTARHDKGTVPPGSTYTYLICAASNAPSSHLTGHLLDDRKNGVYHFSLGQDKGLLMKASFTQVKSPEYQALMIVSSNNPLAQLKYSYSLNMSMIGNLFMVPGSSIYFNPSIGGLGDPRNESSHAARLGLGGYFDVQNVRHNWAPAVGWSTEVDAISNSPPQNDRPPISLTSKGKAALKSAAEINKTADEDNKKGESPKAGPSDSGPMYDQSITQANDAMAAAAGAYAATHHQAVVGSSATGVHYEITPSTFAGPIPKVPEAYTRSTYEEVSGCRATNLGPFRAKMECSDPLKALPPRIPEQALGSEFTRQSAEIALSYLEVTRPLGVEAPGPFDLMEAFSQIGVTADNHMDFFTEGDDIAIFQVTKQETRVARAHDRSGIYDSGFTTYSWDSRDEANRVLKQLGTDRRVPESQTYKHFSKYNFYCYKNWAHGWFIYQFSEVST